MKQNRRQAAAITLKAYGINLEKDFFELRSDEITTVDNVRKSMKFSGRNSVGRSRARQFYYFAQSGHEQLKSAESLQSVDNAIANILWNATKGR